METGAVKDLRKSLEWPCRMCVELFWENGVEAEDGALVCTVDGTVVREQAGDRSGGCTTAFGCCR